MAELKIVSMVKLYHILLVRIELNNNQTPAQGNETKNITGSYRGKLRTLTRPILDCFVQQDICTAFYVIIHMFVSYLTMEHLFKMQLILLIYMHNDIITCPEIVAGCLWFGALKNQCSVSFS